MVDRPNPAPGWYPDPLGAGSLRAWDGTRWTTQTRRAGDGAAADTVPNRNNPLELPRHAEPGAVATLPRVDGSEVSSDAHIEPRIAVNPDSTTQSGGRSGRRKDGTNAIIVVLLLLFALSGVYEVVTGSSSNNNNPTRFATPTTAAAAGTGANALPEVAQSTNYPSAPPSQCTAYPSAADVVLQLGVEKFPVAALPPSTSTTLHNPAHPTAGVFPACSTVTFVDRRGTGVSQLAVYRSLNAATHVASQLGPAGRAPIVVGGVVVLTLNPSLSAFRSSYQAAIQVIVLRTAAAATRATTAPSTATAVPQPRG